MMRIENAKNPTAAQLKQLGEYHAYAADFGKDGLVQGRDFDQWIEVGENCPDGTVLHAEWPHTPNRKTIRGYVSIRHGEQSRGKPAKPLTPVRIGEVGRLETDFRFRVQKNGRMNVLDDTFLYVDPKQTKHAPQNAELCIYHWPDQSAVELAQRSDEKQLGTWTDRWGRNWWMTYFVDKDGKRITRFLPFDAPALEGTLDKAAMLRLCVEKGTMDPAQFYIGAGIGPEPITGTVHMVIDRWRP